MLARPGEIDRGYGDASMPIQVVVVRLGRGVVEAMGDKKHKREEQSSTSSITSRLDGQQNGAENRSRLILGNIHAIF